MKVDLSLIENLLKNGKRIDGRKFDEFREIRVETNLIKKAEGSALVSIGNTKVLAGVKLEISEPFKDNPNEGILIVNAEFSPIASPEFEPGPPDENSIELARVVDRGIRESKFINLEKLCIKEGEKVYGTFVDIHILNNDGNLIDASFLASIFALKNTKIPKYDMEKDEIIRGEYIGNLEVNNFPVMITICEFNGNYLIDPNYDEEKLIENKISVCSTEQDKITALQKQGSKSFDFDEVERILSLAIEKGKEIRKGFSK